MVKVGMGQDQVVDLGRIECKGFIVACAYIALKHTAVDQDLYRIDLDEVT